MTGDTKLQDTISRIHGKLEAIGDVIDKSPSQIEHGLSESNIIGGLELFEMELRNAKRWLYWSPDDDEVEE